MTKLSEATERTYQASMNRLVRKKIRLPGGKLTAYLYDCEQKGAHVDCNLVAKDRMGRVIWTACPGGSGPDHFVDVRLENGKLKANSWTCYLLTLDPENGTVVEQVFTK